MKDIRAKLRLPPGNTLLKDDSGTTHSVLLPLEKFQGMVFPYSPNIQVQHSANYGEYDLTHTNYTSNYFMNSRPPEIAIDGMLTAQTDAEARYMLAVIHFFRIVTKMRTGFNDPDRGVPPPVLRFSAYGDLVFSNIPVVVRSFSHNFQNDVDYVDVFTSTSATETSKDYANKMPSAMNIFVSLAVQPTPSKIRSEFTLSKFSSGELVKKGYI